MINISVNQFVNQIDESYFTLYAEWQDTCFKIILLQSCKVPLSGEMCIEDAKYFLNHLDENFDTYLEKTRRAFAGEDTEIQFFLQDNIFIWKQENILTRGKIAVHPPSDVLISGTLKQALEYYQRCRNDVLVLEKENDNLKKINAKLVNDIEEMINIKNTMETDLYRKFILLLNTKKKKIRELQEALDSSKQPIKSIYNETTDESEESDVESKKMQEANTKPVNEMKRKMDYTSEQEAVPKNSKTEYNRCINLSFAEDIKFEPSTSTGTVTSRNTNMHRVTKYKEPFNTSEEDSEEDLFAQ